MRRDFDQDMEAKDLPLGRGLFRNLIQQGTGHLARLSADAGMDAANAILTTDLVAKTSTREVKAAGVSGRVTGFAKGSGMIHPTMVW